jgi:plasmid stability protein
MATIIIHLDDEVAERLRLQARLRGVSVEQEARRLLTEGTRLTRAEIAARAAEIRGRQRQHGSRGAAAERVGVQVWRDRG